jgi:hypothetical protein
MPFCANCGTQIDGAKFCPNCGVPQGESTATPTPTVPVASSSAPIQDVETTIWETESKSLAGMATGGKITTAKYRLTNRALYFERGTLRTDAQQIPLWAIRDIDLTQSLTQKARGVGTLIVHTDREAVRLENIEHPRWGRDSINEHSLAARHAYEQRQRTWYHGPQDPRR